MALMGWWPLIGNLDDYSGNGFNGTALGSLNVVDGGKLGQAFLFQNNDNGVNINENFTGWTEYTMCAWINPAGNHRNYNGTVMSSGNWNGSCWAFGVSQDNKSIDVAGPSYNKYISYNIPLNKWTHIMCIVKNSVSKLYVNGSYIGERSVNAALASDASNMCIGRETYAGGHFSFNGKINDARIYSHCLSTKEIKELLKAKVLHYTFDNRSEEPTTNLWTSDNTLTGGGTTPMVISSEGVGPFGKTIRKVVVPANCNTGYSGCRAIGSSAAFQANVKYSYLTYVKGDLSGINIYVTGGYGMASLSRYKELDQGEWRCYACNSASIPGSASNYITFYAGSSSSVAREFFVACYQLERKDYVTPFTSNSRSSYVTDASGLRNYGVTTETLTPQWTSNSALGSSSCLFKGNQKVYRNGTRISGEELTLAAWVRPTSFAPTSGDRSCIYINKHYLTINPSGKVAVYCYGKNPAGYHDSNQTLALNTWSHIAVTWSTTHVTIYINGVVDKTLACTGSAVVADVEVGIGMENTGRQFNGGIDDVRVYASALSSSDIMELYGTKGSISRNGKLYCNEVVEKPSLVDISQISAHSITSTGVSLGSLTSKGTRRLVSSNAGVFRFNLPYGTLENGKEYTFSFGYRHIVGNTLSISDFCDMGGDIRVSNGTMSITSSRSSYDNTFKFVDCNIGANAQIDIHSVKLYEGKPSISSINKKGQFLCNEVIECDTVSFPMKVEHGVNWVRLYYHNSRDGAILWGDHNEFLKCLDPYKMSNLWALEQFRGKDGKFEFLMQCSGASGYNRWKQSNNFTTSGPVTGYETISCSWTSNGWYGLEGNPNNGNSHADGCAGDTWWYAIGPRVKYGLGMPCPNIETGGACEIWVRCEDPGVFKMNKDGTARATEFIEI